MPNASPASVDARIGVGWATSVWKTDRNTLFLRARAIEAAMVVLLASDGVDVGCLLDVWLKLAGGFHGGRCGVGYSGAKERFTQHSMTM